MDQFAAVVESVTLGVSGLAILALVVDEVAQILPRRVRAGSAASKQSKVRNNPESRLSWGLHGKAASEVPAV